MLIISGPNTPGGKPSPLKIVGLFALMVQAAAAPCAPGSDMALFSNSMPISGRSRPARDLYRFSAHMTQMIAYCARPLMCGPEGTLAPVPALSCWMSR